MNKLKGIKVYVHILSLVGIIIQLLEKTGVAIMGILNINLFDLF
jgi:hypothetical protein